ncbi:hypothetical protein FSP39_019658 [Pinctada imbricata]|uniref:Cadherin domain-containing protein n=1 Tax=Pinctada imbricata TaxID=66713 RepID=A0AA89C0K0_PINIB|nr:hypothetical protein FSP39_019658 [Pinctada imbricata]
MDKHFFSVLAVDNAREPRTAQAMLEITVRDINDKAPVFESNVSYQDISESIAVGSPVLTVKATDDDAGPNAEVRYFLINSGPPNDVFLIDPTEGTITTRSSLDRENIASYKLLIRATDQGPSSSRKSATATVNVRLIDENDNYPQFTQRTYHVNVSEDYNYSQNPIIITVNATDLDDGINKDIYYAIFGGNTQETFAVNRLTGAISIQRSLDYEETQQFQLSVRAQDGGQPPLTNSTTVVVDILDVNDNDPQFYSSPHIGTVLESASINSTVLNVQARDADSGRNQELVYSIIDAPANLPFFIVNGEIKVKSALDREQGSNYEFVVKAQDRGIPPRSATSRVQITVRDVNDNSPVFDPKFYNVTVAEDLQVSSRIISLTATDADSGDNSFITYSIRRGNENNVFRMTTANGEGLISLIRELDYKTQNVYILTVLAVDPGNLNDTATVQINVLDTNQHKPAFQGTPYTTYVDENIGIGTSIYKVLAIDQDVGENARVSYQILGNTDFQIDANTGEITTRIELDRETKLSYNFEVTAHDNGQPSLTATEMVTIFVQDVNDNSPEFTYPDSQDSFVGSIAEDARPAQSVLTVAATDRDKGPNALIRYKFLETTDPHFGDFDIDSASGVVRVAKSLDRETVAQYRYTAVATDSGVPPRSSSVLVTINIEDVNDNPPIFDDIVVKVAENTPIGSVIAQISAVDPDEGINAQIEYEKVGGRDMNSFDLDFRPGGPAILKNRIDLDFESLPNQYEVMIRAKSDPFFKDAKVYIQVQDINDNEPILKDFTIIFNNYVYKFISGPIGRVPATDPDEIDRDRLRYEIVAGNEASFIHLNQTTGELTLDYRLNSDVPRNGSVEIKVSGKITFTHRYIFCTVYHVFIMDLPLYQYCMSKDRYN